MLRTIDRYVLRETLPMVFLVLLVLTFVLLIPPLMQVAQNLLAKGVDAWTVAELLIMLVPQGLGVTIPMAVLVGLLMGLGRMSSDRETVALQACGVSIYRLLRPVAALGLFAAVATAWVVHVALPGANQRYREIVYERLASRAADEIKPRVFYQGFPGVILYIWDIDQTTNQWTNVFMADSRDPDQPLAYLAEEGRVILDQEQRLVDIVLDQATGHSVSQNDPTVYDVSYNEELVLKLDPETIFPAGGPDIGYREMTMAQLQAEVDTLVEQGVSPHNPIMEIHQKFSLPVACLVFGLLALGLGVTSRKDGKLASFAIGIGVIFTYYILMYGARAMAKGALISPHFAMWVPDILLGFAGIGLLAWRSHSAERRINLGFGLLKRTPSAPPLGAEEPLAISDSNEISPRANGKIDTATPVGVAASWSPGGVLSLLDRYVGRQYLKLVALSFVGLLGIFYISTFIDLSDKLFKGETTLMQLGEYFYYATPQFMYFVLPISALVATLITIGVLTKSSELTVMKACGISLYRAALPLILFSLTWSGVLFAMEESFLADANRRAEALRHVIRGGSPQTFDVLNRKWVVSPDGDIYNYVHFDPTNDELRSVTVYDFDDEQWRLKGRSFAARASYHDGWEATEIWTRSFEGKGDSAQAGAFDRSEKGSLGIEPPAYFSTEQPDAQRMSYQELGSYIGSLEASGVDVVKLKVDLERKLSFPFVTLILTLIAVPFAVTTGRHGALYGVGIGITLAIGYWVVISVFAAIGSAGLLSPLLAAWAPNVLFGGSAIYLLLTVPT